MFDVICFVVLGVVGVKWEWGVWSVLWCYWLLCEIENIWMYVYVVVCDGIEIDVE